ncbi:MAG: M1 family metallopeptidase [Saprospiraceae bacterium]|nr:M1 family metallopeptidase [Saprospiraceae bacterium]
MLKYSVLVYFLLGIVSVALGQETDKDVRYITKGWKYYDGGRNVTTLHSDYNVHYYRLNLTVSNPGVRYLSGSVTTYFKPKTTGFNAIHFNFMNNMTVDSVKFHNALVSTYSFTSPTILRINLPVILPVNVSDSITVYYKGAPIIDGFGSFGIGSTGCSGSNTSVMWTLSEPYGAKTWWPCKETLDDKADSLDLIMTVPQPYRVAGNGLLVQETTNPNNTKTYRWKHRYAIPAYLVAFAIANYSAYSNFVPVPGQNPIEVLNYIYPCNTTAQNQTPLMTPMFQYFIQKFGTYPYNNEKYGHAQCGFGGGMEHSTMSFMGGFSRTLMAHELAHQWFGDKITCGSWQDIWLNEGFATYLEGLICQQGLGDNTWTNWKTGKINSVTGNNLGSTYVTDTTNVSSIFSSRLVYNKGALILHMLRWKLGDNVFFQSIYNYINDPVLSYGFAKTPQLKSIIESTAGVNLTEFFNDWLYGQGWPNYNITWSKDTTCQKIYVTINQTHSANQGTFFEMPVPVSFTGTINGNTVTDTVVFDQNSPTQLSFDYYLGFNPTSATFDPEKWLCAKATITEVPFNNRRHIIWQGDVNDDWHNAANWDCGIPTSLDDVTIPAGMPVCVIKTGATANCRKLTVKNAASLVTQPGAILNINN